MEGIEAMEGAQKRKESGGLFKISLSSFGLVT
jgi:hypothetical protein